MMSHNLPSIGWPTTAVDQAHLLKKLQQYIQNKIDILNQKKHRLLQSDLTNKTIQDQLQTVEIQIKNCELPFESTAGLCSGLTAYWLYSKRTGNEHLYIHALEHALNWTPANVEILEGKQAKLKSTDLEIAKEYLGEDPIIEKLLNNVAFLHFDNLLREGVNQENLATSFELLLGSAQINQELGMACVFNKESLKETIDTLITPTNNKMVYLSNLRHAVGLMHSGNQYFIYDPNSKDGPKKITSSQDLVDYIFEIYRAYEPSEDHLALNISILGMNNDPKVKHPDTYNFTIELIEKHPNLLKHLNRADYLHMLVKSEDLEMVKFLSILGVRFDSQYEHESLAGLAIEYKNYQLLYLLLSNGANIKNNHLGSSLWETALCKDNPEAIVLLLAFGYTPPKDFKDTLNSFFDPNTSTLIIKNAIILQEKLLHAPKILDLSKHNGHDIVMFLRRAKLMRQLQDTSNITVRLNGKAYTGEAAFKCIADYYKAPNTNIVFDFTEKAEIYNLLKYFKSNNFNFTGSRELINLLIKVEKQITKRKISDHSPEDLVAISVILEQLSEIIAAPAGFNPKKNYIHYKAKHLKGSIINYLHKNGIDSIYDYIATTSQPTLQRNYIFFTPEKDVHEPHDIDFNEVAEILQQIKLA